MKNKNKKKLASRISWFQISALNSYLEYTGCIGLEATIIETEVQEFLHVGF